MTEKKHLISIFLLVIKLSWRCFHHHRHGRVASDLSSCARGCLFGSHFACSGFFYYAQDTFDVFTQDSMIAAYVHFKK